MQNFRTVGQPLSEKSKVHPQIYDSGCAFFVIYKFIKGCNLILLETEGSMQNIITLGQTARGGGGGYIFVNGAILFFW